MKESVVFLREEIVVLEEKVGGSKEKVRDRKENDLGSKEKVRFTTQLVFSWQTVRRKPNESAECATARLRIRGHRLSLQPLGV